MRKERAARKRSSLPSPVLALYSAALAAVLVLGSPFWLYRMATSGRYRQGLGQRLGLLPQTLAQAVRGRRTLWVHAVSVGEVLAVERLLGELQAALPSHVIAVSTTTATGQAIARERLGGCSVFFFPLDFGFAVRAWLRVLRPELVVLVESELWPRLLAECARRQIPVAVVNARVSDRSFRRTLPWRAVWLRMADAVTLFLPQGAETAERLAALGVEPARLRVPGNLKFDPPPAQLAAARTNRMVESLRGLLPAGASVVVCGSTLADEEAALLTAWTEVLRARPGSVLLLAPRHPERFDAVAELLRASPFSFARCSSLQTAEPQRVAPQVLLLDTLGDLAAVYELADAAFVGGSLVGRGGHNPLEAARWGAPVLMGRSYENFRELCEAMRAAGALTLVNRGELAEAILTALAQGRRAQPFTPSAGATARTAEALLALLPQPSAATSAAERRP